MKIKSILAGLCLACVIPMSAQSSDVSSFNRITVGYMGVFPGGDLGKGLDVMNGATIGYNHGFGLTEHPMFIELGGNVAFFSGNETNFLSLIIPVNYSYWFNVTDNVSIAPYTGINFRANLYGSDDFFKIDGTKRFQMGWQIGLGANIKKIYLGLQYGIDFMPLVNIGGFKLNTSSLTVNLGLNF